MTKVAESPAKSTEFKTIWVKVSDIIPTKDNTRNFEDPARQASLKELADNIKAKGLLQPIVIRPHPTKPGKYDLRAGERRWRAHKLAGLDKIEARVRKMSDLEAQEATFIENFNREELTPMETAQGIKNMIQSKTSKTSLREISEHLGMSVSMVLRRARLTELIKPWQKAMEAHELSNWGTGHYMSISRFDAPVQQHIYDVVQEWDDRYNRMTLSQFEKFLAEQTRVIALAKWDPADETLVAEAGACSKCPFRSGCKPGLFDEMAEAEKVGKKDRCLNLSCWEKKEIAFHERAKVELIKNNPGIAVVSSQYNAQKGPIPGRESIEPAKKGEKGAFKAVWDDGEDVGKVFYAKASKQASKKATQALTGKEPAPTPLKERRAGYTKRRNVHVLNAMVEQLKEGKVTTPKLSVVLTCAAVFGTSTHTGYADPDSWEVYDELAKGNEAERVARLWEHVAPVVAQRLRSTSADSEPDMKEAARWGALLGINLDALQEAALAAIPDPKIWETLNENGTPKKEVKKA